MDFILLRRTLHYGGLEILAERMLLLSSPYGLHCAKSENADI